MKTLTRWLGGRTPRPKPILTGPAIAYVQMDAPRIDVGLVQAQRNNDPPVRSTTLNIQQGDVEVSVPVNLKELLPELERAQAWERWEDDDD